MYAWQMYLQRNRRLLMRGAVIGAVASVCLLMIMPSPRAGVAMSQAAAAVGGITTLMSPHRFETRAFLEHYLSQLL